MPPGEQTVEIADVAVVPSLWEEPFGLTVLEAMAAGLPLIATRCGGIPEVCEGVSLLIDRNNIRQNIVQAITHLYENPEEAHLQASKAAERSWHFDKTLFSEKYLQALL